jgi:hypothetical protein
MIADIFILAFNIFLLVINLKFRNSIWNYIVLVVLTFGLFYGTAMIMMDAGMKQANVDLILTWVTLILGISILASVFFGKVIHKKGN